MFVGVDDAHFCLSHLLGAMIQPPGVRSGANSHMHGQILAIIELLAHIQEKFGAGQFPQEMFEYMDNVSGDNKNTMYHLFGGAVLVRMGIFRKVTTMFSVVGHTHNDVDSLLFVLGRRLVDMFRYDHGGTWTLQDIERICTALISQDKRSDKKMLSSFGHIVHALPALWQFVEHVCFLSTFALFSSETPSRCTSPRATRLISRPRSDGWMMKQVKNWLSQKLDGRQ